MYLEESDMRIGFYVAALFFLFLSGAVNAQNDDSMDSFRARVRSEFGSFRENAYKEYNDFRQKANEEYVKFMREKWVELGAEPPIEIPKVKPVPIPEFKENEPLPAPIEMDYDEVITPPAPQPQPTPIAPVPEVPDYHPNDEGESPLSKAGAWLKTTCPKCGGEARRETDTMPNWAGSSWYFLRYCDPHNDKEFASKVALEYWMPVDWYNGGMEHTTLHLLYSRFWNKFLFDCGLVPFSEPYKKRTSHGMILASNGEKMSKSRGNVINPDDIVSSYGADTFRLYEMFIGPFDQVAMWSEESLMGVYRFVNKVYGLFKKVDASAQPSEKELRALHKCIKEVTERIDQMKFNTAVSSLMSFVNSLSESEKISAEVYGTFVLLMCPFTPHLAEEMWARLGHSDLAVKAPWPVFDPKLAEDDVVTIAVQLNGKMRGTIEMPKDAAKNEVEKAAFALENIKRQTEGKDIRKVIVVPNKIVNIVAA